MCRTRCDGGKLERGRGQGGRHDPGMRHFSEELELAHDPLPWNELLRRPWTSAFTSGVATDKDEDADADADENPDTSPHTRRGHARNCARLRVLPFSTRVHSTAGCRSLAPHTRVKALISIDVGEPAAHMQPVSAAGTGLYLDVELEFNSSSARSWLGSRSSLMTLYPTTTTTTTPRMRKKSHSHSSD